MECEEKVPFSPCPIMMTNRSWRLFGLATHSPTSIAHFLMIPPVPQDGHKYALTGFWKAGLLHRKHIFMFGGPGDGLCAWQTMALRWSSFHVVNRPQTKQESLFSRVISPNAPRFILQKWQIWMSWAKGVPFWSILLQRRSWKKKLKKYLKVSSPQEPITMQ